MAKAIWEGRECDVRVDTDLEANFSVSILSGEYDPVSLIKRPAAPIIMKLRAKSRWLAMDAGLRALKAQGKISDYTIEPRPQEGHRGAAETCSGAVATLRAAAGPSCSRARARLRVRTRLARKPKWRMRTKPEGSTWSSARSARPVSR